MLYDFTGTAHGGGGVTVIPRSKIRISKLARLRMIRGMTQVELAEAVDAPVEIIRMFETNQVRIVPDARRALARALNVKPGEIGV